MPLFIILSAMLVVQSAIGWLWIRRANREYDRMIQEINHSVYDAEAPDLPGDPPDGAQPGSKPLAPGK